MSQTLPELKSRPAEWYQVTYNLAAQKAHIALEAEAALAATADSELGRAMLWFRRLLGDRDPMDLVRGYQREAHEHAHKLLQQTALALQADDLAAEQERSGRVQPKRLERKLRKFLEDTVEPTGAVLLAGLTRSAFGSEHDDSRAITTRDELVEALNIGTPAPTSLVGYVMERRDLSYRVHYNLACYFADENTRIAWENFREAISSAPRFEATVLADWARRDPSLEPLRQARGEEFEGLVRLYSLPRLEKPGGKTSEANSEAREMPEERQEPSGPAMA